MSLTIKKIQSSAVIKSIQVGDSYLDVIPSAYYTKFYYKNNNLDVWNLVGFSIYKNYLYVAVRNGGSIGSDIYVYDINTDFKRIGCLSLLACDCNAIYVACGRVTIEYSPTACKTNMDIGYAYDGAGYIYKSRPQSPETHYVQILNDDGVSVMAGFKEMK